MVDDAALDEATAGIAEKIASGPVKAQTAIRKLYWASLHNGFEEQIDLEDSYQTIAAMAPEAREGVAAFQEKRKADFRKVAG